MSVTYFKMVYASGHRKYVKTDTGGCEIVLITPFEKKHKVYRNPYPISEESNYDYINEEEYNQVLEELGIQYINRSQPQIKGESIDNDIAFLVKFKKESILSDEIINHFDSILEKLNLLNEAFSAAPGITSIK